MTETEQRMNERLEEKVNHNINAGGHPKYHEKMKEQNKLFVRDRLALLFDDGKYYRGWTFCKL